MASFAACLGLYGVFASTDGVGVEGSFWSAVWVCQPVIRSFEIVLMRPSPGGECRDTVERR